MPDEKDANRETRDGGFRGVNPPIHLASTVLYDTYESFLEAERPPYHGKLYGTYGSPVQLELERSLCELEGGFQTRACHSGFDAIGTVLMAFASTGDHLLVCDSVYGPTRDFCTRVLSRYGVEVEYVPATVGEDIASCLRPSTRLIYLESPGSNTFELQDVPAVAAVARERGVVTVLDNTWSTPLLFDAFAHGVDVTIHSASKYIVGHSDTLLGTITAREEHFPAIEAFYETTERFAAPESCYRALKGLQTLWTRLSVQSGVALDLARWLSGRDEVDRVLYPALESHPEHELWRRDFTGASAVFGFTLTQEPDREAWSRFLDPMSVFELGLSWGGYQSLIKVGKATDRSLPSRYEDQTIVRLSVGLEEPDSLREDLDRAFHRL